MMNELQRLLGHTFRNEDLLREALTHRSFHEGSKKALPDNEKLEFLGDSVINLVVTEFLFRRFRDAREGELSKLKAHLVSSNFLFQVARTIRLGDFVLLGRGEEQNNGRRNRRIVASTFEALAGAVYLDGGFRAARTVLLPFFQSAIDEMGREGRRIRINDFKSELQERMQSRKDSPPEYHLIAERGKLPRMEFTMAVMIGGKEFARGVGETRRQAEQDAASRALHKMDGVPVDGQLSSVFFLTHD
ncbi:MAG TPA: ribonuclease III [Candidatus Aminicenantes bacterium]|nr:ribonuclease III [Candidatus Aminicenantes bacterium]